MLVLLFPAVLDCVQLHERLRRSSACVYSAGQPVASQISRCWTLPVSHPVSCPPISCLFCFVPKEFQGGLLFEESLTATPPSCFLVGLVVLVSPVLLCTCPRFCVHGIVVYFSDGPFTSTFTSSRWILVSKTTIFCRICDIRPWKGVASYCYLASLAAN